MANHKYYIGANFNTDQRAYIMINSATPQGTGYVTGGVWRYIGNIVTGTETTNTYAALRSPDANATFIATKPIVIDLTEMFGETKANQMTVDECDKLFGTMDALPQGLTIAKPAVFTSTGFNQFNPENVLEGKAIVDNAIEDGDKKIAVIPCLPCRVGVGENNGYCIHGEFGEDIKVYLTPLNPMEVDGELYMHELTKDSTTDTYVPQIKGYMLVEVPTTANLCAHFLWSEDKCERDTYEPYFESKVELPHIPEMSEYGLAGIQSKGTLACDEIDFVKGVYRKKIGAVDMGSLSWYRGNSGLFNYDLTKKGAKKAISSKMGNIVCKRYSVKRSWAIDDEPIDDHTMMLYVNGYLYINDLNYVTAAELKSALSGETLYYELAEPIEYPLPKVANNYTSSDYGVEQFDSAVPCNANNLYYMRSLAGETRNFLDRLMAGFGTQDATAVADRILAVVNPTVEPANVEPETPIE